MARWPHGTAEAIAVLTGQGEERRVTHAIQLWESDYALQHLLIANGNTAERTYTPLTRDYLGGLGLHRSAGPCLQTEPAPNTGLQAGWIAGQVRDLGIGSLQLAVTPYHLPRVYLTVLKALNAIGVRIPLVPCPVPVSPDAAAPETGVNLRDLLPGEAHRIVQYASRGWVATIEEFREYEQWLWRHCKSRSRPNFESH